MSQILSEKVRKGSRTSIVQTVFIKIKIPKILEGKGTEKISEIGYGFFTSP